MPIVTQETADGLFANYPLILDSYPQHEPIKELLEDKAIPEKYKKVLLHSGIGMQPIQGRNQLVAGLTQDYTPW